MTEPIKIESPDVEAGRTRRIAPGSAVKPMRDRKRRRKHGALHIEFRARRPGCAGRGGQKAQEQRSPFARARNAKMLLAGIEPGRSRNNLSCAYPVVIGSIGDRQ